MREESEPDLLLSSSTSCWIITDGKAGTENQCLGVAEALGIDVLVKRIALRFPFSCLPPNIRLGKCWAAGPKGDALAPPWPDLVIASGRASILPALHVKAVSGAFLVQLQGPRISLRHFDLVAVPRHDRLRGENVVVTYGAPNRITQAMLDEAGARFAGRFAHLPDQKVAALIGGDSKAYRFDEKTARKLADDLRILAKGGRGVMVTVSRRTPGSIRAILAEALDHPNVFLWDGTGDNPYFGMLALAEALVVTCDSVSMISEAGTTGKPVHVVSLPGGTAKFTRFHANMENDGVTRPFTGKIESWSHAPLRDAETIARAIAKRLNSVS
ncbi:MAG: mitochondrial fission ELM1 family protein [Pseudomonadota bacterium]|nr:mitochondrial fission ELM1 family protein [Pseudomonadota bacterium]